MERRTPMPMAPGRIRGLGHAWALLNDPLGTLQSARTAGDVAKVRLGPFTVVVVNCPQLIRSMLVGQANQFVRGRVMVKAGEYLGKGMLFSDGPEHLRQRRLSQPSFHRARIACYVQTMRDRSAAMTRSWQPGQRFDWYRMATNLSADIVSRTLISGEQGRELAEVFQKSLPVVTKGFLWRVVSPMKLLEHLPTPHNLRTLAEYERMRRTIDAVVASYLAAPADRGDLVSMLIAAQDMDTGEGMSAAQIRAEMMNIVVAAIETTASTLA